MVGASTDRYATFVEAKMAATVPSTAYCILLMELYWDHRICGKTRAVTPN